MSTGSNLSTNGRTQLTEPVRLKQQESRDQLHQVYTVVKVQVQPQTGSESYL